MLINIERRLACPANSKYRKTIRRHSIRIKDERKKLDLVSHVMSNPLLNNHVKWIKGNVYDYL